MAALFGTAGQRGAKKHLVEFKAGKMYLKGKMCHPDKRKGLLYITQSEDSLMHLCWKDRTSGKVDDDLIVFPDDAEFKRVPECTTGRVFVLKFKNTTRKIFWMQEPKADKDDEYCKKVNDLLNNPPTPGSNRGGYTGSGTLGDLQASDLASLAGETDLTSILNGMSQDQIMRLFGGITSSGLMRGGGRSSSSQVGETVTPLRVHSAPGSQNAEESDALPTPQPRPFTAGPLPASQPPESRTASQAIQLSDLQSVLSNIQEAASATEPINFVEVINAERMIPILADPAVQERLTPYLPQDASLPSSQEELRTTITSPQFQQALAGFSSALASGQLGPVLTQFGLGDAAIAAANKGDVQAFVKAMQDAESKKEEKMDES